MWKEACNLVCSSTPGNRFADNECAHVYGVNNTWIAYIDADEFFDTPSGESMEAILRDFEMQRPEVGALGVNWEIHTSAHQRYHVDSVRKTYLECIYDDPEHSGEGSDSKHIKSIVRTDAYVNPSKYLHDNNDTANSNQTASLSCGASAITKLQLICCDK